MKILFFGNADFGIPTLDLLKKTHNLLSVVTNIDKRSGRGKKLTQTPIKHWAIENKIDAIQQDSLHDPTFFSQIKELDADIFIVIAYRLLPSNIFNIPTLSTLNLHASILPKYRGAAPIQRALLNGEEETGISTFIINEKIDKGNLILQKKCKIENQDNYGTLYSKLSLLGANLVMKSIKHLEDKEPLLIQKGSTTYAKKIKKAETQINWKETADNIINKIRAFSPNPGAFTHWGSRRIRLFYAEKSTSLSKKINPGEILLENKNIFIGTGTTPIIVEEIQLEGKSKINSDNFINGYLNSSKRLYFEN